MPLSPDQLNVMRGHPTAPGPPDPQRPRRGLPSPGNGTPGLPRLRPSPTGHGPGIPGHTPTGPMQPGVDYPEHEA